MQTGLITYAMLPMIEDDTPVNLFVSLAQQMGSRSISSVAGRPNPSED